MDRNRLRNNGIGHRLSRSPAAGAARCIAIMQVLTELLVRGAWAMFLVMLLVTLGDPLPVHASPPNAVDDISPFA